MSRPVAVVDLFSGPGGLGEGFSAFRDHKGRRRYKIELSVEKDAAAHRTLRLRAFLRQFDEFPDAYYDWLNAGGAEPSWSKLFPRQWAAAEAEARCLELGRPETTHYLDERLRQVRTRHGERTILIGGPPCQAYSLVGRARNVGKADYRPELDRRHFLYEEYVHVLSVLAPAAFVMENVKGMLSSAVKGDAIFSRVLADLRGAAGADSYRLVALSPSAGLLPEPAPSDFIVRAEDHGIPQARHRVIIVGVRSDLCRSTGLQSPPRLVRRDETVDVSMVLGAMQRLRSGLSKDDGPRQWSEAVVQAATDVKATLRDLSPHIRAPFAETLESIISTAADYARYGRTGTSAPRLPKSCPPDLREWLLDPNLRQLPQHETRGHMPADLGRYMFAACFGRIVGRSPKAADFPSLLAPDHRNWSTGKFSDRFRVQMQNRPATTITSHIAKDGHYFIHPDPNQCRSLTVREAARLQTFPDNYVFLGNRTEQYVQVGNAVPPFLALQIAESLSPLFNIASKI